MSNIHQKVSWELYKSELETIYQKSKAIKNILLKKAWRYTILSNLINYPTKLLLGVTVGGGAIQLFTTPDTTNMMMASVTSMLTVDIYWIQVLRMIFEIIALVLVITRDYFQFETQIEKFYAASQSVESFCSSVKYQSFLQRENEGDRYEILLMFKKLYEEMISNNKIIQTIEILAPATPEEQHRLNPSSEMDSATSSEHDEENPPPHEDRRSSIVTEHGNRMLLLQTQLERIPK